MKNLKTKCLFAGMVLLLLGGCNNPFLPPKAELVIEPGRFEIPQVQYTVEIVMTGNANDDLVTAEIDTGYEGDTITFDYYVDDTSYYNQLAFSGSKGFIAPVDNAGSGTRAYTIDPDDATDGMKIIITAAFTHVDLTADAIRFSDPASTITVTYGDAPFSNAITDAHSGSGAISYSSADKTIATVDNDGEVSMHKAGTTTITARKAADAGYAESSRSYTLTVNPKPVTISVTVADKVYDRTTTATISGATINGLVSGDTVTINYGTAAFATATVGNNKTVTFSGFSLGGANAGNYTLSAQPESVTANIKLIIEQVRINAGTFTMGSPESEPNRYTIETQHSVTLTKGFYMGKYPVTQAQYEAVTGNNPSNFKTAVSPETSTANRPVEMVSWYDALVFCNKLSVSEGLTPAYRISGSTDPATWGTVPTSYDATWNAVEIVSGSTGYRLPTEAQWEYACRAGTATAYNTGATISDNTGWYSNNSDDRTHSVGEKPANPWGLYDMHGNVNEWCWDWYGDYESGTQTDPTGAVSGIYRVIRGGSWVNVGQSLRSAYRSNYYPNSRYIIIGFRLVRP
jgi:formylglycine-generating enzyme required for sulfatase activity